MKTFVMGLWGQAKSFPPVLLLLNSSWSGSLDIDHHHLYDDDGSDENNCGSDNDNDHLDDDDGDDNAFPCLASIAFPVQFHVAVGKVTFL